MRPDAEDWIRLSLLQGIGNSLSVKLIRHFGSPGNIFSAAPGELGIVAGTDLATVILKGADPSSVSRAMQCLSREGYDLLTLCDPDYPVALSNISSPPLLLYLRGNRNFLTSTCFAVVGSRNPTPSGLEAAFSFSESLGAAGLCIVSGVALGIDGAAHRGGLAGGSGSIGVLGTGIDIAYPSSHRTLYQDLEKGGLLLSEFPPGTKPLRQNFPRRNRIISGLSIGCLVVEAGIHSGSLITARHALEQGRDVFAVPGSIHSPLSKGPHELIRQGAILVERVSDILEQYSLQLPETAISGSHPQDDPVLSAMGFDPVDFDTLVLRTGISPQTLSALLVDMEISGSIRSISGGLYQRFQ